MANIALFLIVVVRLMPVAKDVMKGRQLILACSGSINALQNMLIRLEKSAEGRGGKIVFSGLQKEIRFEKVSYRYPNGQGLALNDVNLTIKCGSFATIVGPSGSGKSTLIDLIPSLRSPNSGLVKMDEERLDNFTLNSLQARFHLFLRSADI